MPEILASNQLSPEHHTISGEHDFYRLVG